MNEDPKWFGAFQWCAVVGVLILAALLMWTILSSSPKKELAKPVQNVELLVENSLQKAQDSLDLVSYFDSLRRMDSAALAQEFARKAAALRPKVRVLHVDSFRVDTVPKYIPCEVDDVRTFMASESAHVVREDSSARELGLCRYDLERSTERADSLARAKAPSCFWPSVKACLVCGVLGVGGGAVGGAGACSEMSRP